MRFYFACVLFLFCFDFASPLLTFSLNRRYETMQSEQKTEHFNKLSFSGSFRAGNPRIFPVISENYGFLPGNHRKYAAFHWICGAALFCCGKIGGKLPGKLSSKCPGKRRAAGSVPASLPAVTVQARDGPRFQLSHKLRKPVIVNRVPCCAVKLPAVIPRFQNHAHAYQL